MAQLEDIRSNNTPEELAAIAKSIREAITPNLTEQAAEKPQDPTGPPAEPDLTQCKTDAERRAKVQEHLAATDRYLTELLNRPIRGLNCYSPAEATALARAAAAALRADGYRM